MNMNHQNGETQAYFNLKHTSAKLIKCKREIVHISLTTFSDSNCLKLLTSITNINGLLKQLYLKWITETSFTK